MSFRRQISRLLPLLFLPGCGQPGDTLRTAETVALADSTFTTLAIDPNGAFWLGRPGAVVRLDSATASPREITAGGKGVPEKVGAHDGKLYFRTPESLILVQEEGGVARVMTDPIDAATLDVLGRFVFTTSGAGTVVAYDASNLEPVWGWAAIGTKSEALAVSPEGDRVYQPAAAYEFRAHPEILIRDVQTGRVLRRVEMPGTVRTLVSGRTGSLYGAMLDDAGQASIFALEWEGGDLTLAWTRSLERLKLGPSIQLATSPAGTTMAVVGQNEEAGVHLLEVETGRSIDRLIGPIVDFAFDPEGRLWVLYPGELRRLE